MSTQLLADTWKEYELIDSGNGERLERWGECIVRRPDPQVLWAPANKKLWKQAKAHYFRAKTGGGHWEGLEQYPRQWKLAWNDLTFLIKPTDFKHMGLFPEQAANWHWCAQKIKEAQRPIRVLNLFAYTGGATVSAAYAGAEVCHVDAAKGMVNWAKENLQASDLADKKVRFITDDVLKFVQREKRRESYYDAIIMDPPSYGRGSNGETWKIEHDLYPLIKACAEILTDNPLFFLINGYTAGLAPRVLQNLLQIELHKYQGSATSGEIGIPHSARELILPCGVFGRWEST